MSILDKATSHFKSVIENEIQSFRVEEWDETIYFRPTLTWKEQSKILDLTTNGKTSDALIETIIIRCLNKDGSKMFAQPDKVILNNSVDPGILLRIVGAINGTQISNEDLEKN